MLRFRYAQALFLIAGVTAYLCVSLYSRAQLAVSRERLINLPPEAGERLAVDVARPRQQQPKLLCSAYEELRTVNFLKFKRRLCVNAEAYKKSGTVGYPVCSLPNPFVPQLMRIVRQGSAAARIRDMSGQLLPMFVYPMRDLISDSILRTHSWEPRIVRTIMTLAMKVPEATFLDAGCNIGVYSLLAARLDLPVVSLDANIRNLLRLQLSLNAAALKAALVWNFIGSGDQLSYLNFPGDCNVGGATKFGRAVRDTIPVMPVRSEQLCRLIGTNNVVIKLDVEGGEADFLRTSGCLFSRFKVAIVQMEFLKRHMVGNDSATIVNFFTTRKYTAWKTPELSALDVKKSASWEDCDLLWVHPDFQSLLRSN